MSTVLTYGTFDLFHIGHVRLLRRLSGYGDRLIVGCSTDEFNTLKGKKCVMPYDQRCEILNACKFVSKIIPENSWEQKEEDVIKENVQVFGIGDDWRGAFDHLRQFCRVVYLPRTEGISTTELREAVKTMYHLG
ncbi:adenylyltransferase/cytidyltransferase family protein [Roseovarius sp. SYSU LYC5161]|uniref:adenylyltransferase/cytidyltransferase family protein n=1 Tax=Roseovarius halophilus (ex Wu et al. 2025) TaxID=3376060 RepID=UPI003999683A